MLIINQLITYINIFFPKELRSRLWSVLVLFSPVLAPVSLFGHFSVLVEFDYDSVQLCVCNYPVYFSSCLFS